MARTLPRGDDVKRNGLDFSRVRRRVDVTSVPAVNELLSLFPPSSAVDGDGMLLLGGCRADALAEEFGTPALIVDEPALRARAREYRTELAARRPRSRVVFASKAFPATAVQRVMVEEGVGLDVAGGGRRPPPLEGGVRPPPVGAPPDRQA